MSALVKVDTPLMERYYACCENCGFEKQFFGTAEEARRSADLAGWQFRVRKNGLPVNEEAYCPHCALLVKP